MLRVFILATLLCVAAAQPTKAPTKAPTNTPTNPTPTPRGMFSSPGPEPTPSPPAPTFTPTPPPTIIDRNPTSYATMQECETAMRNRWLAAHQAWNWCRQHGEAHFLRVRCSCACLVNNNCRRRLGEVEPDWLAKIPLEEREALKLRM